MEIVPNIAEDPNNPTPKEEQEIAEFTEQAKAAINEMNDAGTGWILPLVPQGNQGGAKPNITISTGAPEKADWGYTLPDETLSGDPVHKGSDDVTHATITVDPFADEYYGKGAVKAIIMHELGHAMRADYLTDPGNVMTGLCGVEDPPCSTLSPTDIDQLKDGCNSKVVTVDSSQKSAEHETIKQFVLEPLPWVAFDLAQAFSLDDIPLRPSALEIVIAQIDALQDKITVLMAPNGAALLSVLDRGSGGAFGLCGIEWTHGSHADSGMM